MAGGEPGTGDARAEVSEAHDAPLPMRRGVRLGVDVGEARVGLAASDPAGVLATPVATLPRDQGGLSDVATVVAQAHEREAVEVVVGLPRNMDGTEGASAQACRAWAARLAAALDAQPPEGTSPRVGVRLVDERLSTVDAHRALRAAGVSSREHRTRVDQAAAVTILQTALDAERTTGRPPGEILGRRKPRSRRASRQESKG